MHCVRRLSCTLAALVGSMATAQAAPEGGVMSGALAGGLSLSLSRPRAETAAAGAAAPILLAAKTPSSSSASMAADAQSRFDLSVANAPAAQVFLQLGAGTPYNILVSPEVSGSITVSLKNTTVLEALDSLRELFGYDYRIAGNRVFVTPNSVQTRLFRINYLPGRRQGESNLRVTSSAITQAGAPGTSSAQSGSTPTPGQPGRATEASQVRMSSDADFWVEVQRSLVSLVGDAEGRSVVLNPSAGVIVVKALPSELRQVENYLKAIQVNIERQVMLEAKIVEVELSNDSQTGVNWTRFRNFTRNGEPGSVSIGNVAPGINLPNSGTITTPDGSITAGKNVITEALGRGFYGLTFQAAGFAALITFLETQGNVQVLSSPRIATLNNQKAVLKVGSDELFVTGVTSNTTTNGNSTVTTPTLTLQPFFSGISLDVTPQIDDSGNVMLHVHPAISNVSERQKVVDLGDLGNFRLPLASAAINETDSIVRVRDGQIVAIGGLMRQSGVSDRAGVPGLSDVPAVGGLFRQKSDALTKRELVILIKPTIIGQDGRGWESDAPATPALDRPPVIERQPSEK